MPLSGLRMAVDGFCRRGVDTFWEGELRVHSVYMGLGEGLLGGCKRLQRVRKIADDRLISPNSAWEVLGRERGVRTSSPSASLDHAFSSYPVRSQGLVCRPKPTHRGDFYVTPAHATVHWSAITSSSMARTRRLSSTRWSNELDASLGAT
eukprot:1180606-Prorocentrum_minimum.AAC.1